MPQATQINIAHFSARVTENFKKGTVLAPDPAAVSRAHTMSGIKKEKFRLKNPGKNYTIKVITKKEVPL